MGQPETARPVDPNAYRRFRNLNSASGLGRIIKKTDNTNKVVKIHMPKTGGSPLTALKTTLPPSKPSSLSPMRPMSPKFPNPRAGCPSPREGTVKLKRGSIKVPEGIDLDKLVHQISTKKPACGTDLQIWLQKIPLLSNLTDTERLILAKAMERQKHVAGTKVITQGEIGEGFFIIESGTARVTRIDDKHNENLLCILGAHDYFGEAALLKNTARGASVTAREPMVTYFLHQKKFSELFKTDKQASMPSRYAKRLAVSAEQNKDEDHKEVIPDDAVTHKSASVRHLIYMAMSENSIFADISAVHLNALIDAMWRVRVHKGQRIYKMGEIGKCMFVVQSGEIKVNRAEDEVQKLPGQVFGELAMMYESTRQETVKAAVNSTLWCIDRFRFRRIVMNVSREELQRRQAFMGQVELLKPLTPRERTKIAEALENTHFSENEVIIQQGDEGDAMYIIAKGQVQITKTILEEEKVLGTLKKGDFFGERALLKNEARAATITAMGNVQCWKLDRTAFTLLLGPLEDILADKFTAYDEQVKQLEHEGKQEIERSKQTRRDQKGQRKKPTPAVFKNEVQKENLVKVGILGKGSFGTVWLMQDVMTKKTYALKMVSKAHTVKHKQEQHMMNEKNCLAMLSNHPFIIKLHATYQDPTYLYFLLEPCMGGELFSILRTRSVLDENSARFYCASTLLIFEYMHDYDIIYRDLKPENLLLDNRGYMKITDFGFAKQLTNSQTHTLCGTPDYLAPEVIAGTGHGKGVDWWCLGIMTFEMLGGQAPFYHHSPMKSYQLIKKGKVDYPFHFSQEAVAIIAGLLKVKVAERLGIIRGGSDLIKKQKWFKGFEFEALLRKEMKPPVIPKVTNDCDISNFDDYSNDPEDTPLRYYGDQTWCKDF